VAGLKEREMFLKGEFCGKSGMERSMGHLPQPCKLASALFRMFEELIFT